MTFGTREWTQLALLAVVALITGAISHAWGAAVAFVLAILIVMQARDFLRFEHWSRHPLQRPDISSDLWQVPAERLFRSYRASRIRTKLILKQLQYLRSATEALPDGAVLIKHSGEIEMYNLAAQSLLGLSRSDVGQNLVSLVRSPPLTALIDGQVTEGLVEIAAKPSDRRLEIRRIDVDPERLLILARDVTQLNRLLSMRQDFIANVSHELRTPLTVIRGYLESLDDPSLDTQQLHELVNRLRSPSERMQVLVDDLLLLTRLESSPKPGRGDVTLVSVTPLLQTIAAEARQLSNGRHQITVSADPNLKLAGVESELHSAFANLVGNAVRYSPNGGDIDIRWYSTPAGPRFEVSDHGIGIPLEHLNRITERFYRVDLSGSRARGGTGLGLAIVKHVLKRHDATLDISSEPGKGSVFSCVFPIPQAETAFDAKGARQ
jgi:two-component system, OmpR family, phosphate regulon sensor histidine kinase PhoR